MPRLLVPIFLSSVLLVGCGSDSDHSTEPVPAVLAPAAAPAATASPKKSPVPAKANAVVSPRPKSHYERLTLDNVEQDGASAKMSGTTDLPEGSKLLAEVSLYGQKPDDTYIGNDKTVIVKGGRWSATVSFPQVAGFAKGAHEASVMFTPRSQTPEIVALVGEDGERLKGPYVRTMFDIRTIEVKRRVRLSVAKRSMSMPSPDAYGFDDPRHSLAIVLTAWKAKRWSDIVDYATLADDSSRAKLREMVDAQFGFRDLESASIGAVDQTGLVAEVTVDVAYSMGSDLRKEKMKFVLDRLDVHGNPDPNGRWRSNLMAIGPGG